MRVLGLDPSSSKCGYALVFDGEPVIADCYKPDQRFNHYTRALKWGSFVSSLIGLHQPDIVSITEAPYMRNAKGFRVLVIYESVAAYEVKRAGRILIIQPDKEIRKIVFDNGSIKKEDAFKEIKYRYPEFIWLPIDKGGDDMADAIAAGLAGPAMAERR